jgi:hypothetical protein
MALVMIQKEKQINRLQNSTFEESILFSIFVKAMIFVRGIESRGVQHYGYAAAS